MKKLNKIRLCAFLTAGMFLVTSATPVGATEPQRTHQRTERVHQRQTPYSNESVRRDRENLRQEQQVDRAKKPSHYQFKRRNSQ